MSAGGTTRNNHIHSSLTQFQPSALFIPIAQEHHTNPAMSNTQHAKDWHATIAVAGVCALTAAALYVNSPTKSTEKPFATVTEREVADDSAMPVNTVSQMQMLTKANVPEREPDDNAITQTPEVPSPDDSVPDIVVDAAASQKQVPAPDIVPEKGVTDDDAITKTPERPSSGDSVPEIVVDSMASLDAHKQVPTTAAVPEKEVPEVGSPDDAMPLKSAETASEGADGSEHNDYEPSELLHIATQLHKTVETTERKFLFTTYPACFLGSEAIKALVSMGHAGTIEEAEKLGDALIAGGLMAHATNSHGLKNSHFGVDLFYRFLLEETEHPAAEVTFDAEVATASQDSLQKGSSQTDSSVSEKEVPNEPAALEVGEDSILWREVDAEAYSIEDAQVEGESVFVLEPSDTLGASTLVI